jgi:hypothetical protein
LPILNGGTGQTTANAAFNALAPSQTGNSGKYLTTDGTDTSWASNPLGTVTSVGGTGTVSGISLSGTVTTSGNLTLGGALDLSAYNGAGAFTTLSATINTGGYGYVSTLRNSGGISVLQIIGTAAGPTTGGGSIAATGGGVLTLFAGSTVGSIGTSVADITTSGISVTGALSATGAVSGATGAFGRGVYRDIVGGGAMAIYDNSVTASGTNYVIASDTAATSINGTSTVKTRISGTEITSTSSTGFVVTGTLDASGDTTIYNATVNTPKVLRLLANRTSTGILGTLRFGNTQFALNEASVVGESDGSLDSARLTFSTTPNGGTITERFRFGSLGQFGIGGANYGTTGQVLTSQGSSAAPVWANIGAAFSATALIIAGGGGGGFAQSGSGGGGMAGSASTPRHNSTASGQLWARRRTTPCRQT